ncbi:MAG: hypothetical protein K2K34_01180 [Oscillospiraceae bacterium]|nr:hypothetical protein [Oscillospiraceae bacterium]
MKIKAFLTAAVLSAACMFSSCGNTTKGEPVENNFSEILSVSESPFVSVTVDNVTATARLGSSSSESLDELASAVNSAGLTKNPDPYDLPDPDTIALQIEILRNGSAEQQGMDFCIMNLYKDGTLGVFGTEQFCGEEASYSLSAQDLKKIRTAAEKVIADRTSYPQPMRITDPLSSYSHSGAMILPAGVSWSYAIPDNPDLCGSIQADAVHALDELASNDKIDRLYSASVLLGFPAGFDPDMITVKGWDISKKGDTSPETIDHPKIEYEKNFTGADDYTGFVELESNTVYIVTVTYVSAESDERGFSGSADYYFETGELSE